MLLERWQFLSSAINSGGRSWELPRIFFYYFASVEIWDLFPKPKSTLDGGCRAEANGTSPGVFR